MLGCLTATGVHIETFHEINSNLKAFFFICLSREIKYKRFKLFREKRQKSIRKKSQVCTEHLSDAGMLRVRASVCVCVSVFGGGEVRKKRGKELKI